MDWSTLAAALGGGGVIIACIGYMVKTALDRSLEIRIDRIRAEQQALLEEYVHKRVALYENQLGVYKAVLGLTYRLRNQVRGMVTEAPVRDPAPEEFLALWANTEALAELMYNERALFPNDLFDPIHEVRKYITSMRGYFDLMADGLAPREQLIPSLNQQFAELDQLYTSLVSTVQDRLGVLPRGLAQVEKRRTSHTWGG